MTVLRAGLIGDHISRTRLPAALKIMCDQHGMTLDFTLIDTASEEGFDFDATLETARRDGWTGMTVTHPWKTHARSFVDGAMMADAAHLGACNTVRFAGGLCGYNTDYSGILSVFESHLETRTPGRVLMMGAGGVAEAIGPALILLGHELKVFDLEPRRAEALAARLGQKCTAVARDQLASCAADAQGLVNATALGMAEYPGSAFSSEWLGPQSWAFDAVYTPPETQFLAEAKALNIKTISGFELFCAMAIRSFEAYSGLATNHAETLPLLMPLRPE